MGIVCIQELSSLSGIYKSRQWKTDHQASSCHTSILPRVSKDSLQHALLTPMLLQTKFSAAFLWFSFFRLVCCVGGCTSRKHGCGDVYRVVSIFRGTTLFSLNSCSPSCHSEWRCPLRAVLQCLQFPAVHCLLPRVGLACVCLHICVRLTACDDICEASVYVWFGGKICLQKKCAQAGFTAPQK